MERSGWCAGRRHQVAAGDHPLEPVFRVQDEEFVPDAHPRLPHENTEGLFQRVFDF
jgi:hypothetical protein